MASIFELIDSGDAEAIRELVARDPAAAAARDDDGLSALMRAAYRGGEVFAAGRAARPPLGPVDRIMVDESENLPAPDTWTPDGFTGLHLAAFAHNEAAARVLLEAGADPDVVATAPFARVTPLGTAAFSGATSVARVLLDHGASTEPSGERGGTPLHSAAQNGNRELVELLLERGADRRAQREDGTTPADCAATDELREFLR